jgi:hypothetical protein
MKNVKATKSKLTLAELNSANNEKDWKRTTETARTKKGIELFRAHEYEFDFIPCIVALPPIGIPVLVVSAHRFYKRLKVAIGIRTGLTVFDKDESRWNIYCDHDDRFGEFGVVGWHEIPQPKISTFPEFK